MLIKNRSSLPRVTLTVEQCQFIVLNPHIFGVPGHAALKAYVEILSKLCEDGTRGAH